MSHSVNLNLFRSNKMDLAALAQHHDQSSGLSGGSPGAGGPMDREDGDRVTEGDPADPSSIRRAPSRSLRQEEVLMYNRAQSRLGEICQVLVLPLYR